MDRGMMNGTVTVAPPSVGIATWYTVVGGLVTLVNIEMIVCIMCHRDIRHQKEFVLLLGTVMVDSIYNVSVVLNGVVGLLNANALSHLCALVLIERVLAIYGAPLVGASVLITSGDRFFAVVRPFKYHSLDARYAWKVIAAFALLACFGVVYTMVSAAGLNQGHDFGGNCFTVASVYITYKATVKMIQIGCVLVAIILYTASVLCMMFGKNYKNLKTSNTAAGQADEMRSKKRLLKVLRTVGFAMATSVTMMAIPGALSLFGVLEDESVINLLLQLKTLTNTAIVAIRHNEIRKSCRNMIPCAKFISCPKLVRNQNSAGQTTMGVLFTSRQVQTSGR